MKKFSLFFVLLTLAFLVSEVEIVSAATIKNADYVLINEPVYDDLYLAAGSSDIEADIFGDLYLAGGSVNITGNIKQDLVVLGGRITVLGDVGGDVRVIGGQVAVHGKVADDLIVVGGEVNVGKNAKVGGGIMAITGYLSISGEIKEDIYGGMGALLLSGKVGRDVSVTIEDTLKIDNTAIISGDLKYSALLESEVPAGVVGGEVKFNQFEVEEHLGKITKAYIVLKILGYLAALLLGLMIVMFFPKSLVKSTDLIKKNVWKAFGVGLVTVSAIAVGSLLLLVTIIGIPLSLILLSCFLVLFYVSKIFTAVWLGDYLVKYEKPRKGISKLKIFGVMSGVLLVYYLVDLIPYVGWMAHLILFLIGVGGIVLLKREYYEFLKSKKMV